MAVQSRERSLPDPPGATWSGLVAHRGRGRFCPHPDVGGPPVSGRGESSGGRGRRFSKSAPEIPRRSVLSLPSFLHRLPPRHPLHRTGRGGRSAQIGGGLRVVLLAGESLLLLTVGGMLALHFYMLLLPLSISRSADGAEM